MGSGTGSPIIGLPLQHLGGHCDREAWGTRYIAVPPANGEVHDLVLWLFLASCFDSEHS